MPTTSERLHAIRLKTERAKQQVLELDAIINAFQDSEPYSITENIEPESGDKVYRLKEARSIADECSSRFGEVVYNLRSALDHVAWMLVEANGAEPGTGTYFPICDSLSKYMSFANGAKIQGASPSAISVLDGIQPYKGGNGLLWQLSKLANIDKHRYTIGPMGAPSVFRIVHHPGISQFRMTYGGLGVYKDGAEIGRIPSPFNSDDRVDLQASFFIAIIEPEVVEGEGVVQLLNQFCATVDGVVELFVPHLCTL